MAAVATIASCLAFLAPGVAYYSCSIQSHAIHPPTAPPLSLSETRMTVSNSCRDDDGEIGELLAAELARDDRTRTRTGGRWGGREEGSGAICSVQLSISFPLEPRSHGGHGRRRVGCPKYSDRMPYASCDATRPSHSEHQFLTLRRKTCPVNRSN